MISRLNIFRQKHAFTLHEDGKIPDGITPQETGEEITPDEIEILRCFRILLTLI
jgi:hypothetical protein